VNIQGAIAHTDSEYTGCYSRQIVNIQCYSTHR